jgi:sugar lactone lactonase YvrE
MPATSPRLACKVGATLGEGPFWSCAEQKLWFVDIKQKYLHRFDPATGRHESWQAPAQPGWILPASDGGLMTGLQTGLHRFDAQAGTFTAVLSAEPDARDNRLNDACVDHRGRLWFGSMDDREQAPTGRVYAFDRGDVSAAPIDPVVITNGPAISPEGDTLYHVDTMGGRIVAYDIEPDGQLGAHRLFAAIEASDGYFDGPVTDAEGCLWIGLFGGWGARRYAPSGELLEFVRLPVANVTKLALGGPQLRTAYATTATKGLSASARGEQPHAGDLFAFEVDVPGLPVPAIAL